MYSSCFPWFQLHWPHHFFIEKDEWRTSLCVNLVKRHTSITVSLHWLNVLLMREGECDCRDGWGEGQNERQGQKDRKAWIQESWPLSRFHSFPSSGFWWRKREREKEREKERECTCVRVGIFVHVWVRLHVRAENKWAWQQYGVSVGYPQPIIRSESVRIKCDSFPGSDMNTTPHHATSSPTASPL